MSDFAQVTVGGPAGTIAPATVLVNGNGQDVLLYNTDTSNAVYLTANNSYMSGDAGSLNVTPLGPLQSVVFNGELDVYGVCAIGTSAVVNVYPSATNYTPYAAATTLFDTGPPNGSPYFTIPAFSSKTIFSGDVTLWNSYDLTLYAYGTPGNTGSAQALSLTFRWFDKQISPPVFEEVWYTYIANQAPNLVDPETLDSLAANGPLHGKFMTLTVTNSGTTPINIGWFSLYASPRTVPYSDWRQNPASLGNLALKGLTSEEGPYFGFENVLASQPGVTFGAVGPAFIPLPLYSGPVAINWQVSTAALLNMATLVALTTQQGGDLIAGTACPGVIDSLSNTVNQQDRHITNFPRCPVILIINPAATSSILFSAVSQQAA